MTLQDSVMIFDAGVCYGLGQPWEPPSAADARLIAMIKALWHAAQEAERAEDERAAPAWLSEAQRAFLERVNALEERP